MRGERNLDWLRNKIIAYWNELVLWWNELEDKFELNFIQDNRWKYIVDGLEITLKVTVFALLLGLVIGTFVAIVRTAHDQIGKKNLHGFGGALFNFVDWLCRIYLTIIRGTPSTIQLLLMYFVFMVSSTNQVLVASVSFGINSGAYIAEIIRSGIMSIDKGQMEAGRSLGLSYPVTMVKIILPQAIKNVLPAMVNEMITLLKETSICGYIGLNDLTRGGYAIQGVTYDALMPLLAVALIYLIIVMFFTWVMGLLERRLRESDIR